VPYAASDAACVVAFSLGVGHRLDEPPECVRTKPYGDEPKHDPPKGISAHSLQGTGRVGGATSHTGRCPYRQRAHDEVHRPLGRVAEPRDPIDPGACLLGRLLCVMLGFLLSILSCITWQS
jgi:hypothetical protein